MHKNKVKTQFGPYLDKLTNKNQFKFNKNKQF